MKFNKRQWTSVFRSLPDFLIIGAQKCGTSSLYSYLCSHPGIIAASKKEIHFFDAEAFGNGINWYRAHFPYSVKKSLLGLKRGGKTLTGEASPYYLFYPNAHLRIADCLPDARLIVMLRNPIDRALSHYNHQVRKGREKMSFEEAISEEERRLEGEKDRMRNSPGYYSHNYWAYSYLARGRYVEQLKEWLTVFSRDRFLVLSSEKFFEDPNGVYCKTLRFLGLEEMPLLDYEKRNTGAYGQMNDGTRQRLVEYYKPFNEALYELLDLDMGWK